MQRVCEPELMDGRQQARAYAEADFAVSDQALVERIVALFGTDLGALIVDLGCGPGNISFRLADRYHQAAVLGIDGAAAMLAIAAERLRSLPPGAWAAGLRFRQAVLPCSALEAELAGRCSALVSNSLLHHLHDPQVLWQTVRRLAVPGAVLYVKDLRRPATEEALSALVARHMDEAPAVLRHDYTASLRASFTTQEVAEQLEQAGLSGLAVEAVEDRYLEIAGRLTSEG